MHTHTCSNSGLLVEVNLVAAFMHAATMTATIDFLSSAALSILTTQHSFPKEMQIKLVNN